MGRARLITRRGFMSTAENSAVLIKKYRILDRLELSEVYQLLLMFITMEDKICSDRCDVYRFLDILEYGDSNEFLDFMNDLDRRDKTILLSSAYKIINSIIHETNIRRLKNVLTDMLFLMSKVDERG